MESVLVGVDRSEGSRRALGFTLERARVNAWRVTVAHVVNWTRFSFPTFEENEKRPAARRAEVARARDEVLAPLLAWAQEEEHLGDIEVVTTIRHGRPSEVLSDLAEKEGHDLIVVGRTGESDLRMAIFGSTASRLVQHAPVPVAVVP